MSALAKDEGKWITKNPIRAERAVPLLESLPKREDPTVGVGENDRALIAYLGKEVWGTVVNVTRKGRRVIVVSADDPEISPLNVFDRKHILAVVKEEPKK